VVEHVKPKIEEVKEAPKIEEVVEEIDTSEMTDTSSKKS
jgi:hypothetical protein